VWSFGSHRLVWGSNFPACRSVCSYEEAIDAIAGCRSLWDGDKELILGGNWSRMFDAVLM
jgi:predicted TIM-barrel fold metal-dependent hydrolase